MSYPTIQNLELNGLDIQRMKEFFLAYKNLDPNKYYVKFDGLSTQRQWPTLGELAEPTFNTMQPYWATFVGKEKATGEVTSEQLVYMKFADGRWTLRSIHE